MTKTTKATPKAQKRTPRLTLAQLATKHAELEATLNDIKTRWFSQSQELLLAHNVVHAILTEYRRKYQKREDVLIEIARTLAWELQLSAVEERIQRETAAPQAAEKGGN